MTPPSTAPYKRKQIAPGAPAVLVENERRNEIPAVISIPHSGEYITPHMQKALRKDVLLPNMDWYLKELYGFLSQLGYTVVANNMSRYVADPNRSPEQNQGEGAYQHSAVYEKNTFGRPLYTAPLTDGQQKERLRRYHAGYHACLRRALLEKFTVFPKVYLIDLHSFGREMPPDIVLGNRNGRTSKPGFLHLLEGLFTQEGFAVAQNDPYGGGFITAFYGTEMAGCESVQIELAYKAYIEKRIFEEEEAPQPAPELFQKAQGRLKRVFAGLKEELLKEGEG